MRLALNWKPEPEFGGFYAANYKAHGLDVEILQGGVGTPTVQMVGAGQLIKLLFGLDYAFAVIIVGVALSGSPVPVRAWTPTGHFAIAEIA